MRFEFATASRILFGPGTLSESIPLIAKKGRSAFIITGKNSERAQPLIDQLNKKGIHSVLFNVPHEPTTTLTLTGVNSARENKCDFVIGIGGGSVLDTGKVVAALLTNTGDLFDYLEIVGRALPIIHPPAPYIAISTTSGTGAEVTRNAVLISLEHRIKVSMRSYLMLPSLTIVDPELTYSLPSVITASTGLDALTQLIEPYVSLKANPLVDGICKEGLQRVASSLQRAYENGNDTSAREDMSLASLFGGLALANAGLGAVHGIAAPLGGMLSIPHGIICARLLPRVIEVNIRALKTRASTSRSLKRYDEIARILTGNPSAQANDAVIWVKNLCHLLDVPSLSTFSLTENDLYTLLERSKKSSSMKGNPVVLTDEELLEILKKSL